MLEIKFYFHKKHSIYVFFYDLNRNTEKIHTYQNNSSLTIYTGSNCRLMYNAYRQSPLESLEPLLLKVSLFYDDMLMTQSVHTRQTALQKRIIMNFRKKALLA